MLRKVTVETGVVEGIPAADPRITAFKGIPFAAPPVGELRWRAPQPAKPWVGVFKADHFGPIAMQEVPGEDPNAFYSKEWHVDPEIPMSEDCLQLNVWTPAKTGNEKFPVMVWIYGGGLQCGYPAEMEFDGERIARRGVVLVSVNYRVNVFGFFAHPELTKECEDGLCTNFGLLDQLAGIKWVKRNIAAFGGDPDNITVFGQSAGGGSTTAHICSEMSAGYFQRAIIQSGGGFAEGFNQGYATLEEAEQIGCEFLKFLGVSSIEEARKIDAKTLFRKSVEFPSPRKDTHAFEMKWNMVIDGKFLKEDPVQTILHNRRNPVDLMMGNTLAEFLAAPQAKTVQEFKQYAQENYGEDAETFLKLCGYPNADLETMRQKAAINNFEIGNLIWARLNYELGCKPIYFYRFNPEIPGDDAGSFHSSDLWFVFETLAKCWRPFKGKHYDLARMMCNYWTNFAKTGNPNGLDADGTPMPEWTPFTKDNERGMYFGDTPHMDTEGYSDVETLTFEHLYKKWKASI